VSSGALVAFLSSISSACPDVFVCCRTRLGPFDCTARSLHFLQLVHFLRFPAAFASSKGVAEGRAYKCYLPLLSPTLIVCFMIHIFRLVEAPLCGAKSANGNRAPKSPLHFLQPAYVPHFDPFSASSERVVERHPDKRSILVLPDSTLFFS
jgi:hypothetical protein